MNVSISFVLLLVAFILFVLAALGVPARNFSLLAAGLAFWVLAVLLGAGVR